MISALNYLKRPLRSENFRRFSTIQEKATDAPSRIFTYVSTGDIDGALNLCDSFAKTMKITSKEFLARQCSERSYLIYRLSVDSRSSAIELAQSGEFFPPDVSPSELISRDDLVHEDIVEQYQRARNCIILSRTSLLLGSPRPGRDYQIIGRSVVHKLLLSRTACVLQTYMSRKLQASREPHEWAIANHRKAARLFDEDLAPAGPQGPLEQPDLMTENSDDLKKFCDRRVSAAKQHVRLIAHLTSDVARHVLTREEGRALLRSGETILSEDLDDEAEKNYIRGVFSSTRKALQ